MGLRASDSLICSENKTIDVQNVSQKHKPPFLHLSSVVFLPPYSAQSQYYLHTVECRALAIHSDLRSLKDILHDDIISTLGTLLTEVKTVISGVETAMFLYRVRHGVQMTGK